MHRQCTPLTSLNGLGAVHPADGKPGFDPYLVWAETTRWKGHFNLPEFSGIPVLARARTPEQIAGLHRPGVVDIPEVYRRPLPGSSGHRSCFFTARVRASELAAFRADPGVVCFQIAVPAVARESFSRAGNGSQASSRPVHRRRAGRGLRRTAERTASSSTKATIGVIDDAFAIYNLQFCARDSARRTRIRSLWSQGHRASAGAWRAEPRFGYGGELHAEDIDAMLERLADLPGDGQRRDATAKAYEADRYLLDVGDGLLRTASHGTCVLQLAAGNDPPYRLPADDDQAVPACDIRLVHLPDILSQDMSGRGLPVHVLDGVRYLLDCTPPDAPLVVNVSYGGLAEAHDGSSLLERALDDLLEHRPNFAIVLAAGNGRESRCHWQHSVPPQESADFTWQLVDEDTTDSFLELWAQREAELEITIRPEGEERQVIAADKAMQWTIDGRTVAMAMRSGNNPRGDGQMMLFAVTPRTPPRDGDRAPSKNWRITVRNRGTAPVDVDAYVERDATRSSVLGDHGQPTVAPSKQSGTLSSLATGEHTIVVGGIDALHGSPVATSGEGPSRSRKRLAPDVAAPSEPEPGAQWLCTPVLDSRASNDPAEAEPFSGTSAAAPLVTRWIADFLSRALADGGGPLTCEQIQSAVRGTPATLTEGDPDPDPRTGFRVMGVRDPTSAPAAAGR